MTSAETRPPVPVDASRTTLASAGQATFDVALRMECQHHMSPKDAVREASHQRLRPILMTTACAALGGVPMILFRGTGSEFRQPLGWAIVGGLIVSQVLTLFTTPVVYIYLDRVRGRLGPRSHSPQAVETPA